MSNPIIEVEKISKLYRLGKIGATSLRETAEHMWCRMCGKKTPVKQSVRSSQFIQNKGSTDPQAGPEPNSMWALKNVDLSIQQGEIIGIIGRNGAGKSTLLKILSRITEPTSGRAVLRGRVASLLEVGTGFHPELTGRENIYLNGAILGMRKREIDRKFDEIVAFAEIEKFMDTPVKHYSSGMHVRLGFAVAAHLDPEILLVDEVLAVGDAAFQKKCLGKMNEVAKHGRTVLFVSHNMAAVKSLCKRAYLIQEGSVAKEGKVDGVVDSYLTAGQGSIQNGIISADMPRSGTGEASFKSIQLLNLKRETITQIYLGQKFRAVLNLEVNKPILDAVFGVLIFSGDGLCVASCFSTDQNQPFLKLEKGFFQMELELNMILIPRNYSLGISVFHSDGKDIDCLEQILDFTALSVAEDASDAYHWETRHGLVRPSGVWDVPQKIENERMKP